MTAARVAQLDKLGFAWKLSAGAVRDGAGCETQLVKLRNYKRRHGDCNVPARWAEDPRLGNWVSNQRSRKKKLDRGDSSLGMTVPWMGGEATRARLQLVGSVRVGSQQQ